MKTRTALLTLLASALALSHVQAVPEEREQPAEGANAPSAINPSQLFLTPLSGDAEVLQAPTLEDLLQILRELQDFFDEFQNELEAEQSAGDEDQAQAQDQDQDQDKKEESDADEDEADADDKDSDDESATDGEEAADDVVEDVVNESEAETMGPLMVDEEPFLSPFGAGESRILALPMYMPFPGHRLYQRPVNVLAPRVIRVVLIPQNQSQPPAREDASAQVPEEDGVQAQAVADGGLLKSKGKGSRPRKVDVVPRKPITIGSEDVVQAVTRKPMPVHAKGQDSSSDSDSSIESGVESGRGPVYIVNRKPLLTGK